MFGSAIDTVRVTVARPSPKVKLVAKRPVKRGIMAPVDKVVRMINLFLVNPVPIPGVAPKEILVVQLSDSVVWAENAARELHIVPKNVLIQMEALFVVAITNVVLVRNIILEQRIGQYMNVAL